jgi:hypothetical protein
MKGIGIEKRRCTNCQNMQDVIAIDGAITIFFRCEKCESETFFQDKINEFADERWIDAT